MEKYSYDYVKKYLEKLGYTLLDKEYINYSQKLTFVDFDGYKYYQAFRTIVRGNIQSKFSIQNEYVIENIKLWIRINVLNFQILSTRHGGSSFKLEFKCLNEDCGKVFHKTITNLLSDKRCAHCGNKTKSQIKKLDYNYMKKHIEYLGYILHDESIKDAHSNITLSDKFGYKYYTNWNRIQQNSGLKMFHISNPYTIDNIQLWCNINKKPFNLVSTTYNGNDVKMQWRCFQAQCGAIFESALAPILRGHGCGVCDGKQVQSVNCVATTHPFLVEEWHPTKNYELTPYNITAGSREDIWWKCKNNPKHEWPSPIYRRLNNKNECPFCSNQVVHDGYNLLVCNPELSTEWNYEKNSKQPEEYFPVCATDVWWKCSFCGNEWEAQISNRSRSKLLGCPECNKSLGEQRIKKWLESYNIYYIHEYDKLNVYSDFNNPLRFDFAIFQNSEKSNLRCLVEYDGEFHFKKYFESQNFEQTQKHDKRKNIYCEQNNIRLLRIPYWDFDNIEQILEKELIQGLKEVM